MSIALYQPDLLSSCCLLCQGFCFHEDFAKRSEVRLDIAQKCPRCETFRAFIEERSGIDEGGFFILEILVLEIPEM